MIVERECNNSDKCDDDDDFFANPMIFIIERNSKLTSTKTNDIVAILKVAFPGDSSLTFRRSLQNRIDVRCANIEIRTHYFSKKCAIINFLRGISAFFN